MDFSAEHLLTEIFSEDFERLFLDLLRHNHGSSRVNVCDVYQEMISERNHVHMNATKWASLVEFIRYVGEQGRCKVEETPEGWFVTYNGSNYELVDEERHEPDMSTPIEGAQNIENTSHSASEKRDDVSRVKHQFEELLHM